MVESCASDEPTAEMVDAGVGELLSFDSGELRFSSQEAVRSIYRAMREVAVRNLLFQPGPPILLTVEQSRDLLREAIPVQVSANTPRSMKTCADVSMEYDLSRIAGAEFRYLVRLAHSEGILSEILQDEGISLEEFVEALNAVKVSKAS